MAPASVSTGSDRGFRILSLDGGGVRGLSSLLILRRILYLIEPHEDLYELPKPCKYFDLICGTSTGGLIAIMLGRLGMGVQQCIDAYCDLAKNVFQESFLSKPAWKFKSLFGESRFKERRLEDAIKRIVKDQTGNENTVMREATDPECKVFVCATRFANMELSLLRSYRTSFEEEENCTIWQAARATTAAPLFFDSVRFGRPPAEYVDGGLSNNNPVRAAVQEAYRLSDRRVRIECLLSIGTGIPERKSPGPSSVDLLQACIKIAFDAEGTARRFKEDFFDDLVKERRYFRFNVAHGLQKVKLEEWKYFDAIDAATKSFLDGVRDETRVCANALSESRQDDRRSDSEPQPPWPIYFEVAGAPSPYFTGRDDILDDLRTFFDSPDRNASQVAVLTGLGGIGKTQVALRYIQSHRTNYVGCFFVAAGSEQELRSAFARIAYDVVEEELTRDPSNDYDSVAKTLGFSGLVGHRRPLVDDRSRLVKAVKRWLGRLTEPFLLVFDGADDPVNANLRDYIPRNSSADIIITTWQSEVDIFGQRFEVDVLPEEASVALLTAASRGVLNTAHSQDEARKIVHELGNLPLAIDLAGGYFASSKTDIDAFIPTYKQSAKDLLSKVPSNGLGGYHTSAFAAWEMSYAKAVQYSSSSGSMLKLFSFLYPQDICSLLYLPSVDNRGVSEMAPPERRELAIEIEEGFSNSTKQWVSQDNPFVIQEALTALIRVCLIMRISDRKTYIIHPTVHLWARERLDPAEKRQYAKDAVVMVARALPSMKYLDNAESWGVHRQLQPHIRTCWKYVEKYLADGTDDDRSFLLALRFLASSFQSQGSLITAEKMFCRVLSGQKAILEPDHADTLTTMDNLASIYRELDNLDGNLDKAKKLYDEVLEGRERVLGAKHPDTLSTVDHLGSIFEYQGNFELAEKHYIRALRGREESQGHESHDVFEVVEELAGLYNYHGNLDKAQEFHERARDGRREALGPNDPDTLTSELSFGGLYWAKGDMQAAQNLYEHAYEGRKNFFGPRHPQTLSARNGLASLYGSLGHINEAEQMFREVLDIRTDILGPEHPDTLWTNEGLSGLLINKGDIQEAKDLMEEAVRGIKAALGPNHVDTLWVQHGLAMTYQHSNELDDAERLHRRALDGHRAILGDKHPITLRILNDLGACYERGGDFEGAESAMREAHEGMVELLGFDRPDSLYTGMCLAGALWSLGPDKEEEAERLYNKVLEAMRRVLGPMHPDTWCCLADLGGLYASRGDYANARPLLEECKTARSQILGENHPETRQIHERLTNLSNGRRPSHATWPRRAKTLPSPHSSGRRRRRDERRWISE